MVRLFFALVFINGHLLLAQQIEVINLSQIDELLDSRTEDVKVINFWASWCGPCVKELPYFDAIDKSGDAEVHLVSLDFPEDIDKARRLLDKKAISAKSYLLDDTNYIKHIDERWTGAIPATIIIDKFGQREFFEQAFTLEELQNILSEY